MSKVVFSGCSFTAGAGWSQNSDQAEAKNYPGLWVNLCHSQIAQLKSLELLNYGQGGASNSEIFKNSVDAITTHNSGIKIMICQWTGMPRFSFKTKLELWDTSQELSKLVRERDKNQKYINDIIYRFRSLIHLQGEILKVVEYTNILQRLTKQLGIKLYHINGLCPWDNNYFVRLSNVLPESYTEFTKKEILNIKDRNDEDIFKLYELIHLEYDQVGGIDTSCWINLYNSMLSNIIDTNYDNQHPGNKSNQLYFQQVKQFLESQ